MDAHKVISTSALALLPVLVGFDMSNSYNDRELLLRLDEWRVASSQKTDRLISDVDAMRKDLVTRTDDRYTKSEALKNLDEIDDRIDSIEVLIASCCRGEKPQR